MRSGERPSGRLRPFTTQEVADLLGVSALSVANWVDAGHLEAHRTPGGHRRITQEALDRFCAERGQTLRPPPLLIARPAVLLLDSDTDYAETLAEFIELPGQVTAKVAGDLLSAGVHIARLTPRVVVFAEGLLEARQISSMAELDLPPIRWIACLGLASRPGQALPSGIHASFRRSLPIVQAVELILKALPT
jgi:excisionase family DNA binding protein